ncbi:MAG: 3-deoxy-D-manno-octulosonic acid transferase [Phycisphaerales bacterium]
MNPLDLTYAVGAAVLAPVWARKARGGWKERLGHVEALPPPSPDRPRLLLHAVSVGEVNAIRQLVPMLRQRGIEVVVATGTDTGLERARTLFGVGVGGGGGGAVVRYPLDFSRAVRRFLDAVSPSAVGLVELEVWPNFIAECTRRAVPVGVINGRLSERSFKGYKRIRPFMAKSFASLAFAAVQDDDYAARFRAMGTPTDRVFVTDTMKWDAAVMADDVAGADALAREMGIDRTRPLIVGGSTGPDEEALLVRACPPGVQLLCAPRKVERFAEAAAAMPGCVRRSARLGPGVAGAGGPGRFLLDTIGELRAAYALADVVVMGRSFGKLFGSDPIEPIALGKATVIGPSFKDFQTVVRTLSGVGGLEVVGPEELPRVLAELLADPARRARMAGAGRACIRQRMGATARHADLLEGLVRAAPAG